MGAKVEAEWKRFGEARIYRAPLFSDHERYQIIDGGALAEHRVLLHLLVQSSATISKAHDQVSLGVNSTGALCAFADSIIRSN